MSFKLLAIRPMPGTDAKFLKNLKPGVIYKFYQEYEFLDKDGNDISKMEYSEENKQLSYSHRKYNNQTKTYEKVVYNEYLIDKKGKVFPANTSIKTVKPYDNPSVPENLYSQRGGPSINISAVVGKNGSGKSALIEFYVRSIYLISKNLKILDFDFVISNTDQQSSDTFLKLKQIFKGYGENLNDFHRDLDHRLLKDFSSSLYNLVSWKKRLPILKNQSNIFESENENFQGHVYYLVDDKIIVVKIFNNEIKIDDKNKHSVSDFKSEINHYNVLTNYSIYGLNPNELGSWITVLFHKNDGYKTPLVINPMKTNGNINVNNDIRLNRIRSFERLIDSEEVLDKKIKNVILDLNYKLKDTEIKIVENQGKIYRICYSNISFSNFFYSIKTLDGNEINQISNKNNLKENEKYPGFSYRRKTIKIITHLLNEIFNEDILLSETYEYQYVSLFHYFLDKLYRFKVNYLNDFSDIDNLIEFVKENIISDNTHKTFKLRQCLYYFKTNIFSKLFPDWTKSQSFTQRVMIDIVKAKSILINLHNKTGEHNNEYKIPITYFNIDFEFEDGSKYSELSSGQLQLLNSLSTTYYHIKNIDSKYNDNSKNIESINLIFDEVELYFHPDFQRVYVNEVINLLKNSKFKYVNTFNVLFLTHSPFILSDIPSQNILRLKDGKPVKAKNDTNSFAANIHDLLADEFFLEDGFMGEFAKRKINEIIQYLTYKLNEKEIKNLKEKIVELKKDGKNVSLQTKKRTFLNAENKSIEEKIKIEKIKKEDIRSFIDLIGEPLIRLKLEQMLKLI